jgi:hypothetical protein
MEDAHIPRGFETVECAGRWLKPWIARPVGRICDMKSQMAISGWSKIEKSEHIILWSRGMTDLTMQPHDHLYFQFSSATNPNISRRYALRDHYTRSTHRYAIIVYQKLETMAKYWEGRA